MEARKFISRNLPAIIIAAIFVAWFFLVGEAFSRYCPFVPEEQINPLSCDVFFWWRWFD